MKFNMFNLSVLTIGVLLIVAGVYRRSPAEIVKMTLKGQKITPGPKYSEEGEEGKFVPYPPSTAPGTPSTGDPKTVPAVVPLPYST
jgi:hypothetical protein